MQHRAQYAYAILGRRAGPWRDQRKDALRDAIRDGQAQRDRYTGRVYLIVPADIITRMVEQPMQSGDIAHIQTRPRLRLVS